MKFFTTLLPLFLVPLATSIPTTDLIPLEERQTNPDGIHKCKIVTNAYVNCHYCYNESCSVVKTLAPGKTYNFDCVCPNGQCIGGICGWDHDVDDYCWVFANATDQNCPTVGANALKECDFCGK